MRITPGRLICDKSAYFIHDVFLQIVEPDQTGPEYEAAMTELGTAISAGGLP
jgi:hypothetical protein